MPYVSLGTNLGSESGSTELSAPEQIGFIIANPVDDTKPRENLQPVTREDVLTFMDDVGGNSPRPATLNGKPFSHYIYEVSSRTIAVVTAVYKRTSFGSSSGQPGDIELSMTTSGASTTVTQALARLDKQAPAGSPPADADIGLAVNVSDAGANGVSVPVPTLKITVSNWREISDLPANFYTLIQSASATVNDATVNLGRYGDFDAGELLFLGASETEDRNTGAVRVDYQFEALPNRTNVSIGGMTFANKKGHDLLWLLYAEVEDPNTGARSRKPVAGFIDQVIDYHDHSNIPLLAF